MGIIFKGNLTGALCKDCKEPLLGSVIRFYRVDNINSDILSHVAADPKETIRILDEKEIKVKSKLLVAEAKIDENGDYSTVIKGNEQYDGPLTIDIVTHRVYQQKSKDRDPIQFTITTVQPRWTQDDQDNLIFNWKYCIQSRFWCHIRELFDAWVICGRLLNCKEKNTPIPGITVIAMDDDWITDDTLGSAVTDGSGHFRIDYTSSDFKKTFLSPVINVETPFPPFNSGPDVYFKLELAGTPIAFEKPSDKRNNVGPCLCVQLCLDTIDIPDVPIPASFTHFGRTRKIGIQSEINSANGKTQRTGFEGYAFYGSVFMIGSLTKRLNNQPMEYLFEYQKVATPTTPLSASGWLPVKNNMIPETVIGNLITLTSDPMNPVVKEPVYINPVGTGKTEVTYNGDWIKVPQNANFEAHQDAEILRINTNLIDTRPDIDMSAPTATIGSATTATNPRRQNEYVAIRMKQREENNPASEVVAGTSKAIALFNVRYDNVNKHGSWAPSTASNQVAAVSVDIDEILSGSTGCNKITEDLNVRYTARHENLGSVALSIVGPKKPGQNFSFPAISLMSEPETFGTTQLQFTPSGQSVKDLLPCAYTITLSATVKLTTGDGEPGPINDFISFCKS
ncbi:hypothetical protein [Aquimarina brevivitae]|uniref:Uncharacterized protein n=1 Tax=Aquimarina brevivitae TaxID=323412 RepID=A0A4Q7P1W6_9FLAO|nr:hypothetical protein [Aquimarina brevivitae]RZS93856.1 hypothetical protein EV197_2437 [Aquimarina brevivitae]